MAALALHSARNAFFGIQLTRPVLAASLIPTFLTAPKSFALSLPSLQSLLELFPPFLLAVPKSKTSHSRKAMRSANKGLKDKQSALYCYFEPVESNLNPGCLKISSIAQDVGLQNSRTTCAPTAIRSLVGCGSPSRKGGRYPICPEHSGSPSVCYSPFLTRSC